MLKLLASILSLLVLSAPLGARADEYADTINLFRNAGESAKFLDTAYGYAVFPTVGKAGLGVGGARGEGRVYQGGKVVGSTTLTQLTIGLQAGGEAYSEIIFFEDARALKEFTSGRFEFGADASAVVITSAAGAKGGSTGASAGASGGKKDAKAVGRYHKGMATFTIAKGGLMLEASLGGQKFSYKPA